jgi:CHRD domain
MGELDMKTLVCGFGLFALLGIGCAMMADVPGNDNGNGDEGEIVDANGNGDGNGNGSGGENGNGEVDESASVRFSARLSGADEVPPSDSIASGSASFEFNNDMTEMTFTIDVVGVRRVTQAHIHVGGADENGGVVAFLFGPADPFVDASGELSSGTITADDLINAFEGMSLSALADEMAAGNTYANVHSDANPAGEIRGQISADQS